MKDFLIIASVIRFWVFTIEVVLYLWHGWVLLTTKKGNMVKAFGTFFLVTSMVSLGPILFSLNGATGEDIYFQAGIVCMFIGSLLSAAVLAHIIYKLKH